MTRWIHRLARLWHAPRPAVRRPGCRVALETLEDRCLLSNNVLQTNLVSDLPGVAAVQDPNLVNPWGIAESPSTATRPGSPFWISDNNAGVSTLYNVPGANNTPVSINSLVVSIPTPGDPFGASGTPTGTVFNTSAGGFKVSGVSKTGAATSAAAIFLFVTEDGTIVGWNPGVNPQGFDPTKAGTYGILAVDNSGNNFTEPDPAKQTGAVYKGLSIATSSTPIFTGDAASTAVLYVTNFRSGQVEVYDSGFGRVTLPAGAFTDPKLPRGYAPFDVQVLNGKVYVTYALQDDTRHDDVAGQGHGFVDVFNLDGSPGLDRGQVRLASRGQLNSPWGLAIAPASFGDLAGSLLVGNFGDGRIHAFDPTTGNPVGKHDGTLLDPDGEPIQIDGLWALKVGNDGNGGNSSTVYFTAGLDHESHGLFGSLTSVAPGSPEGDAEAQTVTAALDVFQLNLATVQQDLANGVTGQQLKDDLHNLQVSLHDLIAAETRFAVDALQDAHGDGPGGEDHAAVSPGASQGLSPSSVDEAFAGLGLSHHHQDSSGGLLWSL